MKGNQANNKEKEQCEYTKEDNKRLKSSVLSSIIAIKTQRQHQLPLRDVSSRSSSQSTAIVFLR